MFPGKQEIAARLYFIEVIRGLNEQRVRLGIKEEERTEELLDMRDELRAEYLALLESEAESSRRLEQLRLELQSLQASLVHWNALKTEDERRHTETIQNILGTPADHPGRSRPYCRFENRRNCTTYLHIYLYIYP